MFLFDQLDQKLHLSSNNRPEFVSLVKTLFVSGSRGNPSAAAGGVPVDELEASMSM